MTSTLCLPYLLIFAACFAFSVLLARALAKRAERAQCAPPADLGAGGAEIGD